MAPKKHARLGASKSKRWMNCTGSVAACADIPDTKSKYAEEGDLAHALAEAILTTGELPSGVEPEMIDNVRVYTDYVLERSDGKTLFIEKQFDLAPLSPPEDMFGTCDAAIWDAETRVLEIVDLKYGQGVYVSADDPQFAMYALGAVVELKVKPARVVCTVVQPRWRDEDDHIRSYEYTWEELVAFKKDLFAKAQETQAEDAPRTVGEWCRFCPAQPTCPAQAEHMLALAQTEFTPMALEEVTELPDPKQLTDEQLGTILAGSKYARDWLTSVEEHVMARLAAGEKFPGYKLVAGTAHRKWSDEADVARYLSRKGLKVEERYTKKVISPAAAERIFKEKGLGTLPRKFVVQPQGAPKLVPDSDKRPALAAGVDVDFTPHTEEA